MEMLSQWSRHRVFGSPYSMTHTELPQPRVCYSAYAYA